MSGSSVETGYASDAPPVLDRTNPESGRDEVNLTRIERWMLSNQYRILEALYPDQAKELAKDRLAIERGYELNYDDFTQHIDHDAPTVQECEEVSEILEMFRCLKLAKDKPEDLGSLLGFQGFDGSTEATQMRYAEYCCKTLGLFEDLGLKSNFNSHAESLGRYRRMLIEWRGSSNVYELTRDDIMRIANA
jgi:uncharacterized protein